MTRGAQEDQASQVRELGGISLRRNQLEKRITSSFLDSQAAWQGCGSTQNKWKVKSGALLPMVMAVATLAGILFWIYWETDISPGRASEGYAYEENGEPSDCNASLNPEEEGRQGGRKDWVGRISGAWFWGGFGQADGVLLEAELPVGRALDLSEKGHQGNLPSVNVWEQPTQCGLSTDSVVDLERRWRPSVNRPGGGFSQSPQLAVSLLAPKQGRELMRNHWDGACRG